MFRVVLINVGDALEATAIRSVLERWNCHVVTHHIGGRRALSEALASCGDADATVICAHGDVHGIVLPTVDGSGHREGFGPHDLRVAARFEGGTVILTSCMADTAAFADAILDSGADRCFLARGHPDAKDVLLAALLILWGLMSNPTGDRHRCLARTARQVFSMHDASSKRRIMN